MDSTLRKAIRFAQLVHKDQVDKNGVPYFLHPLAVMRDPLLTTDEERAAAVLHDVLEDGDYTPDNLIQFGKVVSGAVMALTHKKGMTYAEYINRVMSNPIARKVKLADIHHNLSPSRLWQIPVAIRKRLVKKYTQALKVLTGE